MMTTLAILYLLALVCFVLAAVGVPSRVNLVALGLAFASSAWLVGAARLVP